MHLTYHVLMAKSAVPAMATWQKAITELGFAAQMTPATLAATISRAGCMVEVAYKSQVCGAKVDLGPVGDVCDICDDLRGRLRDDWDVSVNLSFNDDREKVPGVSVLVAALAKVADGLVYIEGDGVFMTPDEAVATAKAW